MINEYVYCPRLFWLEYVEREFEESFDTVDGERVHRRVDEARGELPDDVTTMRDQVTSVELVSEDLGIVAKIDVVRAEGDSVVPIDFKRGKAPNIERGAYDPERVQVCLQALLLREAGYRCEAGRIYFAASKTHVDVEIDDALIAQTREAISGARGISEKTVVPPPLIDSPKCPRCSLNTICLPDETNALRERVPAQVRPFAPPSDDRVPLYVLEAGARVGLRGEVLEVRTDSGVQAEVRLLELASVSLFGNAHISSQAMRAILARDVPLFYLSYGGWLNGYARSVNDHSLDLRVVQHQVVANDARSLEFARAFVLGKVKNQRTMIRRAHGAANAKAALQALSLLLHRIERAGAADELLGFEGAAARHYFESFAEMLNVGTGFEVHGRSRRPPTDPVNALLSFGYAMLAKETLAAVIAVGFEPGLGFYHRIRPGRPSLALDLMEEFRPLIVDSTVLTLINTREIRASHFDRRGRAIVLTKDGRRIIIAAIERRLRSSISHPTFGYTVSYRRALHVQARLLARAIQGDIPAYPPFTTR